MTEAAPSSPSSLYDEYYRRRKIWAAKPQIRLVYGRWIQKLRPFCPEGPLLEVGSGSGLLRDFMPEVILSMSLTYPGSIRWSIACKCLSWMEAWVE